MLSNYVSTFWHLSQLLDYFYKINFNIGFKLQFQVSMVNDIREFTWGNI
jgi:hypothetical protein